MERQALLARLARRRATLQKELSALRLEQRRAGFRSVAEHSKLSDAEFISERSLDEAAVREFRRVGTLEALRGFEILLAGGPFDSADWSLTRSAALFGYTTRQMQAVLRDVNCGDVTDVDDPVALPRGRPRRLGK